MYIAKSINSEGPIYYFCRTGFSVFFSDVELYDTHNKAVRAIKKVNPGAVEGVDYSVVELAEKIAKAAELYADFTGHEIESVKAIDLIDMDVGIAVGRLDGVLYTAVRDGVEEEYIHQFEKGCEPTLVSSFDGKSIAIVGGEYEFTNYGIVDKK